MIFVAHIQMDILEADCMIFHNLLLLQKYLQNKDKKHSFTEKYQ